MNKAKLIAIIMSLFCCTVMVAQNVMVRGKVVDNAKEPIIGASVIIKGSSLGQTTDIDGNFAIKAAVGDVIKVTFIGYDPKETKVKSGENITIVLDQEDQLLDEVVVVGVSMKKSDLTGAVANVSSEVLTQRPVTTINEALQGRVAGVRITQTAKPGDDPSIRIRGTNTINSGADPIYVVDGTVMTNNLSAFSSINLNDVESVQVLKDASATALYGSRGANGVVLITTKKGKLGVGEVSFDGWFGFTQITDRPKTMNAQQLAAYRTEAFANGYIYNNPNANRQEYIDNTLMKTNIAFSKQEFETMKNGKSYDWLDQVLRTGNSQNYNLSFSKATEGTNFYASLGYSSTKGLVEGTDQTKYFGRVNASANINKWIKVGATASYTRNEDVLPSDDVYNKALIANPLLDFTSYKDPLTRYKAENLVIYYRMKSEANNNDYNPFNSMDITRNRDRNYFQSTAYLNINPIEGLNFRSSFALDYTTQTWKEYTPSNIQQAIRQSSGDSRAKQEKWSSIDYQWDNTVSYERTFNNLHRMYVMAGTSTVYHSQDYLMAQGERFASDDLLYNNLGGSAALEKRIIGTDIRKSALVSFLARGNYSYDNRYFATATIRYDGSSRFGKGHKWGVLPSASLGWDITKEHFMADQNIFDLIKLRAGYGVVGNQDIESYAYQTLYYPNVKDGIPSYSASGLRGTPELTWEKQKQTNIGLDLAFFNQRLKMSVDGFFILNENLLMKHALPYTSGYSETWENIGVVQNNGVEISIDANIIQTRDWSWNINASISHDKNVVKELYRGVDKILNGDGREGNIFVGESLNNLYTYRCGGIANESNREQWENMSFFGKNIQLGDLFPLNVSGPDGKIDDVVDRNDRVIVGTKDPKVYGGFATDLTWKGLSLNAVFNYSIGGKNFSGYYEGLINSIGTSMASADILDYWTPQNTNAKFPRPIDNATGFNRVYPSDTDFSLQNTSFLRLSSLSLAYNFPTSMIEKAHIKNLRVYVTASNLFCITDYKGWDPELGDSAYPPTKMFVVGLNVKF